MDAVNQVVIELAVFSDIEHSYGVVAVGLYKILPVAVLVGLVDVCNAALLALGIENISSERKNGVIHAEC